jgi:hypothetical protein
MTGLKGAALSGLLLASCAKQMNYAFEETLPASAFADNEAAEPAGREARQLLASARTVAFYPPDYCINIEADKEQVARYRTLRANCGVLLSSLERAAEKAGYEVVSWQNLRGNQRPIDYAREAKVDVLFEINEFDFGPVDDEKIGRELKFTKWETDAVAEAFTPSQTILDRCGPYAAGRHQKQTVAKVGTIDIKTVSVVDGRNRWRYRKNLTRSRGTQYPRYAFGSTSQLNPGGPVLATFGGIGVGTGSVLMIVSNVSTDDPTTDDDERVRLGNVPLYIILAGAAMLAGGVAITVKTTRSATAEESALCTERAEPTIQPGSSVAVDEETENAALRSEMIGEFVAVIADVRATTPLPPATPPSPPPAPPATAPVLTPAPTPTPGVP